MRVRGLAYSTCLVGLLWGSPGWAQLQAGGLAPPPAVESAPPPGQAPPGSATPASTEADLARADREDSGRGLEFVWLNAEVGVMHLGLGTLSNKKLVDPNVDTTDTGVVVGGGAGVRLVFLTLGARFRYAPLPHIKLWTLGAEAGLHAPFGSLELYGALGLGYASVKLPGTPLYPLLSSVGDAKGFDARLGGGLDYYLTNMFSLGANVSGELLFLSRSTGMAVSDGTNAAVFNATYSGDGSSVAGAVTATAVFGLHF